MFGMSAQQIEGQARIFLSFAGGIAAALGLTWFGSVSQAFLDAIGPTLAAVGPIVGLATAIWSAISKKQANILTTATALTDDAGRRVVANIQLAPTPAGVALAAPGVTPPNVTVAPR